MIVLQRLGLEVPGVVEKNEHCICRWWPRHDQPSSQFVVLGRVSAGLLQVERRSLMTVWWECLHEVVQAWVALGGVLAQRLLVDGV